MQHRERHRPRKPRAAKVDVKPEPHNIAKWTNLWDPMELLAFTAITVFRLADGTLPRDIPIQTPLSLLADQKGWAHSIY